MSKPCWIDSCPLDGSELVLTSGWYSRPSKPDVCRGYCPRCDAAFQLWEDRATGERATFTWRRMDEELVLEDGDQAKVQDFLKHDWEAVQGDMLHGVRSFLQGRFDKRERRGCPNDGGKIPLVAELPYQSDSVLFYWCDCCGELFAFLMDKDYGWQCVASFRWDREKARLVPRPSRSKTADMDLLQEPAASISRRLLTGLPDNSPAEPWWKFW